MRKFYKKIVTVALAMTMALVPTMGVLADAEAEGSSSDVYVSFGHDLSEDQKDTVMEYLGVTDEDLENYTIGEITNEQEHEYLDEYLPNDVIGKRALSSVKVTLKDEGNGINVETHNIYYCTEGMYTNALITAGIEDADVIVAGPFNISGTAALIGTMQAYSAMTGEVISEETMDTAVNELVATGEVAEKLGNSEDAEKLFALVKEKVVAEGLKSEEDISEAIDEAAKQLEITLSDEDRQMILDLMKKISELDIDIDKLLSQAKSVYDTIEGLDIKPEQVTGFFEKLSQLLDQLIEWLNSILG